MSSMREKDCMEDAVCAWLAYGFCERGQELVYDYEIDQSDGKDR